MNFGSSGNAAANTFDQDGQMTDSNPSMSRRKHYDYDHMGRLTELQVADGTGALVTSKTYDYDGLGRLTGATGPFGTERGGRP